MIIGVIHITLHAQWVHSLKEKRMIVKSLCAKIRNKFNVSVTECREQDVHQTIVICIAYVTDNSALSDSIAQNIIDFTEQTTDAVIVAIETETR